MRSPSYKNPHRTFALRAQGSAVCIYAPWSERAADNNTSANRYVPVDTLDGLGRMQTHVNRNEIIRMQFHVAHSHSCAATTRVGGGHRSRRDLAYRRRRSLDLSSSLVSSKLIEWGSNNRRDLLIGRTAI